MGRGVLRGAVGVSPNAWHPCARLAIIVTAMPRLSLFRLSRLALLRRIPFWAQALALCALFAIVGVAVLDDYGVTEDEANQRQTAAAVADYALGVSEGTPYRFRHDRYYGVAFEMPLLLLERALGPQDGRHIYLTRHLLTHLFFIAGGFVYGILVYRMAGSRWIALLAMLMFMLHPRLYAHSFFNTKDIPFAVMMVIALYLAHRAFRKDTLGAFMLCGIVIGLAINLRPFGLLLPPMVLAMRALDLWQAGRGERKHILTTAGVSTGAALAIVYITHPYYWENPLRFIEGFRALSQHPTLVDNLFMGEIYRSDAVPWNYIPVWFGITAPPLTLLLGAVGCATVCWQGISRPIAALRDRETRFRILSLGCFALPIVVVIALQSNIYFGWRHMYFLWAPFCLLAAVGLHYIANILRKGIWKVGARLPGWVRCGGLGRGLAYSVAGIGLITTLTAMAALHPYEHVYFNALTDTKTPGALGERYDMDYFRVSERQLMEYLLSRYPDDNLFVYPGIWARRILPQNVRGRIIGLRNPHAVDFYLLHSEREYDLFRNTAKIRHRHPRIDVRDIQNRTPIHAIRVYGSVIAFIVARDVDAYRAAYYDVAANGTLITRSDFDIYAYDGAFYYLSADCPPPAPNYAESRRIFLHIIPVDLADLPADRRGQGFESRYGRFGFFDDKCVIRLPSSDYQIARIRTGQSGGDEWSVDIDLAAQALYAAIAAGDYGRPVAQSDFDVYLRGNGLAYLKEPCEEGDVVARFFLHIFPDDPADLPADGREFGFANLDFQFTDHGADIGGKCVAERELPGYAIERIRTGQFVSGEGRVWGVEFSSAR